MSFGSCDILLEDGGGLKSRVNIEISVINSNARVIAIEAHFV